MVPDEDIKNSVCIFLEDEPSIHLGQVLSKNDVDSDIDGMTERKIITKQHGIIRGFLSENGWMVHGIWYIMVPQEHVNEMMDVGSKFESYVNRNSIAKVEKKLE